MEIAEGTSPSGSPDSSPDRQSRSARRTPSHGPDAPPTENHALSLRFGSGTAKNTVTPPIDSRPPSLPLFVCRRPAVPSSLRAVAPSTISPSAPSSTGTSTATREHPAVTMVSVGILPVAGAGVAPLPAPAPAPAPHRAPARPRAVAGRSTMSAGKTARSKWDRIPVSRRPSDPAGPPRTRRVRRIVARTHGGEFTIIAEESACSSSTNLRRGVCTNPPPGPLDETSSISQWSTSRSTS
mmetsp:Transcript_13687/g.27318  ORF Transcript_13687/g.27318 Transcript_13687/m.27318 type:complete len:239 (-) Transcript_13687:472-1188(-)